MVHRRTTLLFIAIVLAAGLCLDAVFPISFAQSQTGEQPGYAELKKGDYEAAHKSFNTKLASRPEDAISLRGLLRVYNETGRYAEAEVLARKFLLKNPNAGAVRHELAEVLAI